MTKERDRRKHDAKREFADRRRVRSLRRRVNDAWQGAATGASCVVGKILGATWPAPRPAVLPVPVRTTRPVHTTRPVRVR